ncbi:MAG TPA: methyl-accepting chemotaxis protein [Acetivibrio sp.]|mgnify:CR=1 FL=1|uniref:methyl-accepting chemotaxis protein n=1 Tax=Acetivibrio sp. TaxID=1872092 RepID=UPI002B7EA615|nr:methyl-accepting chemotaxis protein [Acetivibrio sp.]HOM01527.1 methyl-accepting chemotaxis protein [Acetivibrio sp.]
MDKVKGVLKNRARYTLALTRRLALLSAIMILCDLAAILGWLPLDVPVFRIAFFGIHIIIGAIVAVFMIMLSKLILCKFRELQEKEEVIANLMSASKDISEASNELVRTVKEVFGMSKDALNTSKLIASSAGDVDMGSKETLDFINEATKAAVSISKDLDKIASEYVFVSSISQQLKIMTDDSKTSMKKTMDEIRIISENTLKTKNTIYSLKERTSKIEKVVEVITGIANDTSLLSLNASIESAKAGEYGKGFAVVASEVKKLAEQSHRSAQEISQMIKGILADTDLAVQDIDTTAELVSKSMEVINNSANTFEMISVASEEVNDKIQGVTDLTQGVAKNGDNIVRVIENIQNINSKSLAELSNMAESAQQQSVSLHKITAYLEDVEQLSNELLEIYESSLSSLQPFLQQK